MSRCPGAGSPLAGPSLPPVRRRASRFAMEGSERHAALPARRASSAGERLRRLGRSPDRRRRTRRPADRAPRRFLSSVRCGRAPSPCPLRAFTSSARTSEATLVIAGRGSLIWSKRPPGGRSECQQGVGVCRQILSGNLPSRGREASAPEPDIPNGREESNAPPAPFARRAPTPRRASNENGPAPWEPAR